MSENFFSKDGPAVNEHHYHATRKQYNQDFSTHIIYNVDTSKSYKTNNHNFNDNNFCNTKNNHKQFNELHNQKKVQLIMGMF